MAIQRYGRRGMSTYDFYRIGGVARPGGRPDLSPVLPNLLIGEYPRPDDASWLSAAHGVTTVLCLQDEADLASKALVLAELQAAYRDAGMRFHHVPVPDGDLETFGSRLDVIIALTHEVLSAGGRLYIHCNAGMNRAPTVAVAYLHLHHGLDLAAARAFVSERRSCVPYMTLLEAHYRR
jgi:protein-tyrosine phosphatase